VDCKGQHKPLPEAFLTDQLTTFIKEEKLGEGGIRRDDFIAAFGRKPEQLIRAACRNSSQHRSKLYQFSQFISAIDSSLSYQFHNRGLPSHGRCFTPHIDNHTVQGNIVE
jgi:hypothetical protein